MISSSTPKGEAAFSIASLEEAAKYDVDIASLLRRTLVSTYDEFLSVLYDD